MRFCVDSLKIRESKKSSLIYFLIYFSMLSIFCTNANSHYIQTHQYIIALSADKLSMDGYNEIANFLRKEVFDENAMQTKTYLQLLQEGARDADLRTNGLFGFPTTSFNNCWDLTQKDTCDNTIKVYSYDITGWPVGDHFFDPDNGKGIFSTYNIDSYLNEKENECETCFEDLIREVTEKYPAAPDPRQKLIEIMGSSNAAAMAKEFYSRAIIEWDKSKIDESHLINSMYNLGIALHLIQDLTVPHHAQPKMAYENHDEYESQVWKNQDYGLKEGTNTFTDIHGDYKFYSSSKSDHWVIDNAQVFKNIDPYDYDSSIPESIKYLLRSTAGAIAGFFVDVGFISLNVVPDTGLIAYYPFNGNVSDESGIGNNGTVIGASLAIDRFGNVNSSYYFDGFNDYITIPPNDNLDFYTNDFSLLFWFKTTAGEGFILDSRNSSEGGYYVNIPDGGLRYSVDESWGNPGLQCNITGTSDGQWHFFGGIKNGNKLFVYIDGNLKDQYSGENINIGESKQINLGASKNPSAYYEGYLDEVRIYNRAISEEEIKKLYFNATSQPVPDTGQTNCYDDRGNVITCPSPGQSFYGQDANYTINPTSYTKLDVNGNDLPDSANSWAMVRDNVTGLIWEVKRNKDGVQNYSDPHDADNTYTWYDPGDPYKGTEGNGTDTQDFIYWLNNSNFGGFSDWRLPTIKELSYLVNYRILSPGPTINQSYFPNTISLGYFSSNTRVDSKISAWGVRFDEGTIGSTYKSQRRFVRAVRGSKPVVNFKENDDKTVVVDTWTGLMWQKSTSSSTMKWEHALTYCENMEVGGYLDWRLPTIKELRSIVDYSQASPSTYTNFFPDTKSSSYWSSTTNVDDTDDAWRIYFYNGIDNIYYKGSRYYVRCVRGGQPANISITVKSPVAGDQWQRGTTQTIQWESTGTVSNVKIQLKDSSGNYSTIASSVSNSGGYNWTIPSNGDIGSDFKIRISDVNHENTIYDFSDSFSLIGGTLSTPSSITVPTSSNTGNYTVTWGNSSTGGVTYVLEEATNLSFTNNLRTAYSGIDINTTITGRSSGLTYYYRVKASKGGYTDSSWRIGSNGCSVSIPSTCGMPSSISVPSTSNTGNYTVTWGNSSSIDVTYILEEATNTAFTSGLRQAYAGLDTSVAITGRGNGSTYYYRVKATKSGYADSSWRIGDNGCTVTQVNINDLVNLNVPKYDQDDFGHGCTMDCSPVAAAMVLGYWDSSGWPRMVPSGSSDYNTNSKGVTDLVMNLWATMDYTCSEGTSPIKVAPGIIQAASNMDPGAQFVNHSFLEITNNNKETAFQILKGYIKNGWPIIFSSYSGLKYYLPNNNSYGELGGGHSMVMTGFLDGAVGRKIFLNSGWGYPKDIMLVDYDDMGLDLTITDPKQIWVTCVVPGGNPTPLVLPWIPLLLEDID